MEELRALFARLRLKEQAVAQSNAATRKNKLLKLQQELLDRREELHEAMRQDFGKCAEEVDLTEVVPVILEIRHAIRNLDRWMRPAKVRMPLPLIGTASEIHHEAKGVVLIVSPWNFPILLTLGPLVSAVAAGNCAILKPSEQTPNSADCMERLIHDVFDEDEVAVVKGGPQTASSLLTLPLDHIFFTGSTRVGRIVMEAAAANMTSITLELGGKSPAFVTDSADIESSANAIAWGKFTNAGQACVAPDYVLADKRIADELVAALCAALARLTVNSDLQTARPDMAGIINDSHMDRLESMIQDAVKRGATIAHGGNADHTSTRLEPTVLTGVDLESRVMQEEIFGPLLPVITYERLEQALDFSNRVDPPLALYIFTDETKVADRIMSRSKSGGVVINDVGIHFANPHLPFGGIKSSGIGRSHGHAGFLAFSNQRSVMRQRLRRPPTRAFYPPYGETTRKLIDWFLRFVG
ncbi:MAG: aldehyde dehydrogenase family protein [Rhodothermia bacterium]|nr:aldehyde dehydrogenase family protein [Rhodothermia bacterium]